MKIVFGIPFLYPALAYGGAARAAYHLAEALHSLGHTVSVLTTDVWDEKSRWQPDGSRVPFEVVRLRNLSNTAAYRFQLYTPRNVIRESRRLLRDADILHLHTFRNFHNDVMARVALRAGVPYVLSGHGTIPRIERFRKMKRVYDLLLGKQQLRQAAGFIAVTRAEAKQIARRVRADKPIAVIPNGVAELEPPEPGRFREEFSIKPEEKVVLFLGKITRRKGVQHLVQAFSHMRSEARLVIAGNDMGYGEEIRKLVRLLRLESRVIWTGLLSDTRKYQALCDADVTVYPSTHEVFGLVPLESLLCGTPVVVCNDDGCGEIVRKTGGGELVAWGDEDGLRYAIRKQLQKGKDPVELERAAHLIRRHFSWPLIAQATARFYETILASHRAADARIARDQPDFV